MILPKTSEYVKTFKEKDGNKDNKLRSIGISGKKLFKKCKAIRTLIEDLKKIKLYSLPVYDDNYIKTKIRTYGDKVYTKFRASTVPGDGLECESFTIISFDSLIVYKNKYYLQLYLDNCAYKIVNTIL